MELHQKLFYTFLYTLLVGIFIVLSLVLLQDFPSFMWAAIALLGLSNIVVPALIFLRW
jgi:hypothetical protein